MAALRPKLYVSDEDLETLRPGQAVIETVIDAYLRLIERRSLQSGMQTVFAFQCDFRDNYMEGGYALVKSLSLDGANLYDKTLIIIPIFLPNPEAGDEVGHWSLIFVRPAAEEIRAQDSCFTDLTVEMTRVLQFLEEHAEDVGVPFRWGAWTLIDTPKEVPKQVDTSSCGVYVCVYADVVASNQIFRRPFCPLAARRLIFKILKRGKFAGENFSLLEPPSFMIDDRFLGVPTPSGPTRTVACAPHPDVVMGPFTAHDPLLRQLERSTHRPSRPSSLFPPLVRTMERWSRSRPSSSTSEGQAEVRSSSPRPCTSGLQAECSTPETTCLPPEDEEEDALSITTSDISVEDWEEPPPATPPSQFRPSSSTPPSEVRRLPVSPLPIPPEIKSRLEQPDDHLTGRQKRNRRWKVQRPDGSFFRIRAKKLKTLDQIY